MRVLLAVPTFESIYPDTYKALWDMDKNGQEVIFEFIRGYDCATARNRAVMRAQELKADILMMVDNDVTVPVHALSDYMSFPFDEGMYLDTYPVILGSYAHRDTDNIYRGRTCLCKLYDGYGNPYFNYPLESEYTAEELINLEKKGEYRVEIHGGGMGCAIIRTSIFDQMDYPWYDWVNYDDSNRGMLSEDLYFCEKCKAAQIPIYTDTRIRCGHVLRRIQEVE